MAESDPSDDGARNAAHQNIAETLARIVPHNVALGIRFVGTERGSVTLGLPYDEKLIGNPMTRVLHGGAITALMDATCGIAVFLKLRAAVPVATLDLRIDYVKPATPGVEIHARAECFKITRSVAFVRSEAFHPERQNDLVALASGTFIISQDRYDAKRPQA